MTPNRFQLLWGRFWMAQAGLGPWGRLATRMAGWFAPPYKARCYLASLGRRGYVAPSARIHPRRLRAGANVFIGERCVIHQPDGTASVELGDRVELYADVIIEAGQGGGVSIGAETHIQPRCQLWGYKSRIRIGERVEIAAGCAFYPYNHGIAPDRPIRVQPLASRGDIVIEDDAWLGYGVIVLDGVRIGRGAVIGAGAVVTRDVPDGAVAVGVPARVVQRRDDSA